MEAIKELEQAHRKTALPQVQSGDTVRVHQAIREGAKRRIQIFEGLVIRTHRLGELTAVITVRRIASGVGVEKTFLLHSPNVTKVEVMRRSKVRRNFLSYLRARRGKSARLQEISFDRVAANVAEPKPEAAVEEAAGKAKAAEIDQLAASQADDDQLDAEVTEISTESVPTDVSTEALVKDENKAAAADDPVSPIDDVDASDEQQLPSAEVESGVERADNEDTRAQKPVE